MITNTLKVSGLELSIHLGWPEKERLKLQTVLVDLDMLFTGNPPACNTDKLEDTICYHKLIDQIRNRIPNKHYLLIEHLSAEIHELVFPLLPKNVKLTVTITKRPKIENFSGYVQFSYQGEKPT